MPEAKKPDPEEKPATAPKAAARYKVLSSGLTGTDGAHYTDEEVTAEQIGDQARLDKLLAKKAIEAI